VGKKLKLGERDRKGMAQRAEGTAHGAEGIAGKTEAGKAEKKKVRR